MFLTLAGQIAIGVNGRGYRTRPATARSTLRRREIELVAAHLFYRRGYGESHHNHRQPTKHLELFLLVGLLPCRKSRWG